MLPLCLSSLCLAQSAPEPAARNQVIVVHVKPYIVNEWTALQKNELMPALKKAGVKTRTMYQTVLGNSFEYVGVTPFAKFAELDGQGPLGAEGAARLTAKLSKCLDSRQVFISNSLPELSYLPAGEMPPMSVFSRRRIAPGKVQEYQDFIKTEILPIYQKAKVPYTVTRRGLGANGSDFHVHHMGRQCGRSRCRTADYPRTRRGWGRQARGQDGRHGHAGRSSRPAPRCGAQLLKGVCNRLWS